MNNKFEEAKNIIDEMTKKLNKEIGASIAAFTLTSMLAIKAKASNGVEANQLADYMFEEIIRLLDEYKEITEKSLNEV